MNKTHDLKTVQPYFNDVSSGSKKFEIRKNDRNFKVGDLVVLREWNHKRQYASGYYIIVVITYIIKDNQYCKPGYITFCFNKLYSNFEELPF